MTAPTAREQFVEDFTLVVDNNSEAYNDTINSLTPSLVDNAERIKEGYEVAISYALDVLRQNKNIEEVTIDIMAQILQGWGSDAFDDIARHYMEKE
jgi:predicted molibdopterin-dependent oxidoreductase YjgC